MKFTLTQNQTKQAIELALHSNVPLFITGPTGIGKSEIVQQIADKFNLELIDIRLSQVQQFDLLGFPVSNNGRMDYTPLRSFPLATDPLPQGKDGFLIFLDELNSADKYVQSAAYKLILDRMVGEHHLHPNSRIICAGNRAQDMAVVNKLVSPLKTRMSHVEMVVQADEFLEWAGEEVKNGKWEPIIHGFLSFKKEHINNFDPSVDATTYATPRTWKMLSTMVSKGLLKADPDIYNTIIMGTVGEAAGVDFTSFLEVFSSLPSIQDIESDPLNASMPFEIGAKWALGVHLSNHINAKNESALVAYAKRIPEPDLQVVVFRYMLGKYPSLISNKEVLNIMSGIQKSITGTNP